MFARERQDVIDSEIKLCGYFIIITSEKMSAEEAKYPGTGNRNKSEIAYE